MEPPVAQGTNVRTIRRSFGRSFLRRTIVEADRPSPNRRLILQAVTKIRR
jgi:hypothetical protein